MAKLPANESLGRLEGRCLLRIGGEEAAVFLQNIVTQDVAALAPGRLVYACLLSAPGRFLHDLFIFAGVDCFYLDCDAARKEDLVRRLKIFRLRAKVTIDDELALAVYAGDAQVEGGYSFRDPRLEALGWRSYLPPQANAVSSSAYRDRRIHLGVPEGTPDMKPDIDTVADANLEYLHAVSWDKGCFIGQEVTARMYHRGLAKRRLLIVEGAGLIPGAALVQEGQVVGEIRAVNAAGTEGLALLKLSALAGGAIVQEGGATVAARRPGWLPADKT